MWFPISLDHKAPQCGRRFMPSDNKGDDGIAGKWGDTVSPLLSRCPACMCMKAFQAYIQRCFCDAPPVMQFKVYLLIEGGIWLPMCYACCYRFQPTLRFMRSGAGRAIVERTSSFLERHTPRTHANLSQMASKIHGAPAGRAAAEWALINKVLAPIGFPTKMWIAHRIVQSRARTVEQSSDASS